MPEIQHRFIDTNGIRMHLVEAGAGPLVVLLHGFPESWYSWRHQLTALADAGFHVVAPDQRGYGQTDRPQAIDAYSMLHLVGDVVGLIDALGEQRAVVVGHDWGAPVAWHTALFRPDRVRGVAGLSVPFRPRGERAAALGLAERARRELLSDLLPEAGRGGSRSGARRADHDPHERCTALPGRTRPSPTCSSSPDADSWARLRSRTVCPSGSGRDVDFYTREFERTGFAGGLNWYRNIDRNWELTAPWSGAR